MNEHTQFKIDTSGASRIDIQLGVIGATHHAESVILFLTGVTKSLGSFSRDTIDAYLTDAETMAALLLKNVQRMKDDNWNARCSEIDRPAPVREKEGQRA